MPQRRAVITGLGTVSPVGNTVQDTWNAVAEGTSGVGMIDHVVDPACTTQIGALLKNFDPNSYLEKKEIRRLDLFIQYGLAAGIQAVEDCGLHEAGYRPERVGVIMGSGIGGIEKMGNTCEDYFVHRKIRVSPFFVPNVIVNMVSGYLSIRYDFRGANLALATACATSAHAIGLAARLIRWGDADAVVAGGAEAAISAVPVSAFASMKALSSRNDNPTAASRPWDRNRDGFVLGDGAGAVVLEEYEHAKARGATVYAEVAGFGMSGDAHHITSPIEDGSGFHISMENALEDAGLVPQDIDYINAHGTSTPLGDVAETCAVKSVFNGNVTAPISSTKSMIGHLLGAAGAVEAIVTLMAMQNNILPPTINLDDPGEHCDLDYVPNEARDAVIKTAMSNSFGFGGTNGTLIFRR